MHRTVFLPAKRLRWVIVHGDHFARRHNFDRQVRLGMPRQFRSNHILLPYKQNAHAVLSRG
jgi:hypothetical protein